MTPRHLSMLCLGQLASLGTGLCLARLARKFYAIGAQRLPFPTSGSLLADYGWWLVFIPILCVFLVPRHGEDESPPSAQQRTLNILIGFITVAGPLTIGISVFVHVLVVV
jgi:hypothetical protein